MIIDDEKILSGQIKKKLEKNGYKVTLVENYQHFLLQKNLDNVNLFLIDMSLWDGSWIDVIKSLKQSNNTKNIPAIFISWHWEVEVKVEWLDAWADDYIVKPFQYSELLARIRSNMRISRPEVTSSKLQYNGFMFDTAKRTVSYNNKELDLSKKEKQILEYFLSHIWECISKNTLKKIFWEWKSWLLVPENTINVTICNLRKKIWTWMEIKTVRWEWYVLE